MDRRTFSKSLAALFGAGFLSPALADRSPPPMFDPENVRDIDNSTGIAIYRLVFARRDGSYVVHETKRQVTVRATNEGGTMEFLPSGPDRLEPLFLIEFDHAMRLLRFEADIPHKFTNGLLKTVRMPIPWGNPAKGFIAGETLTIESPALYEMSA